MAACVAAALRDLPDDAALVRKLATQDPSPEVRLCGGPPHRSVASRADLSRRREPRRADDGADETDRSRRAGEGRAHTSRLGDAQGRGRPAHRRPRALLVASADSDVDVRRAAFLLLDEKAIAAIAGSAASLPAREEAVSFLTDQRILGDLAATSSNKAVRAAALDRMIEAGSQVDDARNLEIRRMLRDPIFVRSLGRLEIDFRIGMDEKRYVKEDVDAGDEASKGKVLVETVALTIRKGRDACLQEDLPRAQVQESRGVQLRGTDSGRLPVEGQFRRGGLRRDRRSPPRRTGRERSKGGAGIKQQVHPCCGDSCVRLLAGWQRDNRIRKRRGDRR